MAYAAAGAATAVCGQEAAEADINYFVVNQTLSAAAGASSVATLFLAGGTANRLQFYHTQFAAGGTAAGEGQALADIDPNGTLANGALAGVNVGGFNYASNLAYGQFVSALTAFLGPGLLGTMAFRGGYGGDKFLSAGEGFVAFQFDIGAGTQYGWVRVNMDSGANLNSYTVVDYAYGDAGDAVFVGQTAIPEPSSAGALGLLALGGIGLARWRRDRKKTAA